MDTTKQEELKAQLRGVLSVVRAAAALGPVRVAIVGSRSYPHMGAVSTLVRHFPPDRVTVVSGGARGVDQTAERTASEHGIPTRIFPALWEVYGKSAGMRRNTLIIKDSDIVIAFWDGQSRGTANSIEQAQQMGKPIYIVHA